VRRGRRNLAHRARAPRDLGGSIALAKRLIDELATIVVVPRLPRLGLLLDVVHALVEARPMPRCCARIMVDVVIPSKVVLPSLPGGGEGPVLIRVRREPGGRTLAGDRGDGLGI
jgi:hypothetical protein